MNVNGNGNFAARGFSIVPIETIDIQVCMYTCLSRGASGFHSECRNERETIFGSRIHPRVVNGIVFFRVKVSESYENFVSFLIK